MKVVGYNYRYHISKMVKKDLGGIGKHWPLQKLFPLDCYTVNQVFLYNTSITAISCKLFSFCDLKLILSERLKSYNNISS